MADTQEFYTLLTKVGAAALANGQLANTPVNIIELAVGDGSGTNYSPADDMTTLKNERWRGTITEKSIDPDNPHIILFKAIIPATVGGFFVRELATYAEDGTIIHVGNFPEAYKVAMSSGASSEFPITMRCLFTSTKNIKLEVDPHTAIASQEWSNRQMAQHDTDFYAHETRFGGLEASVELIQIDHSMSGYPMVLVGRLQHALGVGELGDGPCGGSVTEQCIAKARYLDSNSLTILVPKEIATLGTEPNLHQLSAQEYSVTWSDNPVDSLYIRLI